MKTNDSNKGNETQNQNTQSGGFGSSGGSGFGGGSSTSTSVPLGGFQDALRSLSTAVPLNRHNTAERQEMLVKVANKTFTGLVETHQGALLIKAENYGPGEFSGVYPVTAFVYDDTNRGTAYVYYLVHEIADITLDHQRLNNGFGSNQLDIPNTVADVINDKSYQAELVKAIARRRGTDTSKVHLLQGYYWPKNVSLAHADQEGHDDATRVAAYLGKIYNCFYTLINVTAGKLLPLNLASLTDNLVIRHEVSELPGYNVSGDPYRSDLISRLSIGSNEKKESFAVTQETTNLVTAHSYVDVAFTSDKPYVFRQGEPTRQPCIPHVIITKIHSDQYKDHRTVLLGILAAFGVGDRTTRPWVCPFRLQPQGKGINLRDLGALGLDRRVQLTPEPGFVDTNNGNMTDDQLRSLLSVVFEDNRIMFSIDVDETSEDAWLMQTLARAARSTEESEIMLKWCDELTNGLTSRYYNVERDGNILLDWKVRLPAASFIDSDGIKRDWRSMDWSGVQNSVVAPNENKYNGSDIGLLLSNIFTNENMDQVQRYLEAKNLILNHIPNLQQYGWFQRYLINDKFVRAWTNSVQEALAQTDANGRGKAELINQPPANALEPRASFSSNMFGHASEMSNYNNGNRGGFGTFGGNSQFSNTGGFFTGR